MIWVSGTTVTSVAALPAKSTAVAPMKPEPVMVTWVPAVADPLLGLTEVTTGPQEVLAV